MSSKIFQRIINHPILKVPKKKEIKFYYNGETLSGLSNETISSSLIANNIHIFSNNNKDGSPQGIFCANGQCSQCLIMANGIAVKACMTRLESNMHIETIKKLPKMNISENNLKKTSKINRSNITVLIVGGGPAGLSAAIELGKLDIETIILDDKNSLGGKLLLQTHKFFGSVNDSYAGTRGFEISKRLEKKLYSLKSINVWLNSTVIGVFSDGIVGVMRKNKYEEIFPEKILITTGAREKMFPFPGNTLPGVYGAGAFQTLVNRDQIKSSKKVVIIGGGNVGLISAYHALQAGMEVKGIVEALSNVGGYKVHADKILRLGVPIFTNHTVILAEGTNHVKKLTIAEIDHKNKIKSDTYKTLYVDTVLVAVGLSEINEFYFKAQLWNMSSYIAGDAQEIAEASSAIFTGKMSGLKIAKDLNKYDKKIPKKWHEKIKILKSKPGELKKIENSNKSNNFKVSPIFHCYQEIPCNPCTSVCPEKIIKTKNNKITGIPYLTNYTSCKGCLECVAICPGLAITLVDYRKNSEVPTVSLAYEMSESKLKKGFLLSITDINGKVIGKYKIKRIIKNKKKYPGTIILQIDVEKKVAKKIAGIKVQELEDLIVEKHNKLEIPNNAVVCRCERVTKKEIIELIRNGITDLNQMKAIKRIGMGSCGGKTCRSMILDILKKEGIPLNKITDRVDRPLFVESPIGALAGICKEREYDAK